MHTHNHNTYTTIHTEGALLPADLLHRISENDASLPGLTPQSYHLAQGEKLNEAVNRSWNRLSGLWSAFQAARGQFAEQEPGTSVTRERWLLPLFQELGFGRVNVAKAVEIEHKSYAISHRWENVPLHLVGCNIDLNRSVRGVAGAARTSPHSLLQEYLNRDESAQWGMVTNGLLLRILRDNSSLTRQAFLEFDLESMFDGEVYSDFVLLWLMAHQSRFEGIEKEGDCLLDRWSKEAQASGTRALDNLRRGVEEAIESLGQGFLQHPLNQALRTRLKTGQLTKEDYYRQVLRLVYRMIFLFTAEDRDLLLLPDAPAEARQRYTGYYSTSRLRRLAERQRGSRHYDRYEGLQLLMNRLGSNQGCPELALPALGGFLFDSASAADLADAKLENQALLSAVRSLAFITEGNTRRAVDYRNLGPEELGSVYESLLELHPQLNTDAGTFKLSSAAGNERKTTGSYYTPSSLIQVLLDSALDPVIENTMNERRESRMGNWKDGSRLSNLESRLLDLKVCDPACGSGHFLIAAAHRIAGRLAEVRAKGDEPSPAESRRALRDVIRRCIYGVDLNPMAVELCKVNLWLESIEPGKPLSFLDAHVKCGNSLVGVGPGVKLEDLEVPDEAFNPVTGDDKATASLLKKRNRSEREGQESLFVTVIKTQEDLDRWLAERERALEAMPEDTAAEVQAKSESYQKVNASDQYRRQRQIADLWTAAFFWKIEEPKKSSFEVVAPAHGQLRRLRSGQIVQTGLLDQVEKLRQSEGFFHWPLEFAEVAARGGFDCVLGNPPWERIKLQEEEFFASRDPEIASAPNKAAREKLIKKLAESDPPLAHDFEDAKHVAECSSKFVRTSSRFPLTAVGDVNTYALFAETSRNLAASVGRAGVIVPTGIATDDTTKEFFGDLVEKRAIASLYDFENREKLFPAVDSRMKFCLLTLSSAPIRQAQFVFFATRVEHLQDKRRRFTLDPAEIALFNPNTRTMPVFRTRADAVLTRAIYQRVPVLVNERTGENPWGVWIRRVFDMNKSETLSLVENEEKPESFKMYEAKMIWQYDHRFGTYDGITNRNSTKLEQLSENDYSRPDKYIKPWYWIPRNKVLLSIKDWNHSWIMGYRDITNTTNERTSISTIIPFSGTDFTIRVLFSTQSAIFISCLLASFNSLVLDYVARQAVAGTHLSDYITKQLAFLPSRKYSNNDVRFIITRVLELTYTAFDLQPYAKEILDEIGAESWNDWFPNKQVKGKLTPFNWDEDRRALLRAELDAYYAALYGLNRKQLRYILDPTDLTERELEDILDPWEEVSDPLDPAGYDARRAASDFPGETFRVLKEKEFRQFGEYRTRRLVLEAWERLSANGELPAPAYENAAPSSPRRESVTPTPAPEPFKPAPAPKHEAPPVKPAVEPKASSAHEAQPTFSDFGLYKCGICGKMVMGFEKEDHMRGHGGKSVEWKKVR